MLEKVYLIGPYHKFRDRVLHELDGLYLFADPRMHRQSSTAKLVVDDMNEAETSEISFAVSPKGSRITMGYSELGAAFANKNKIISVDENESRDDLLKKISEYYFTFLDEGINFMKEMSNKGTFFKAKKQNDLFHKYPGGSQEEIPLNTVYFCGSIDENLKNVVEKAKKLRPDRKFILKNDTYEDFKNISNYDLVVSHFAANEPWDSNACFMMGGAYAHDIPIVIVDEHKIKYPPLQALARRQTDLDSLLWYITEVNNQHIDAEAKNMYEFFKRERQ